MPRFGQLRQRHTGMSPVQGHQDCEKLKKFTHEDDQRKSALLSQKGKMGRRCHCSHALTGAKEKGETVCFQGCTGKGQEAPGACCKHSWIERKKIK